MLAIFFSEDSFSWQILRSMSRTKREQSKKPNLNIYEGLEN